MSWKYIFVFAGNWNQFRDWCRRTCYDETMLTENGEHIVYVDRFEKILGYTRDVYSHAEIRVIGTWGSDSSRELREALETLQERVGESYAKD